MNSETTKPFRLVVSLFLAALLISGCASIYIPKKQRVHIHSNDSEAVIKIDGKEIGTGNHVNKRIEKSGNKQITATAPGYKEIQRVIIPHHRPVFFWMMQPLNITSFVFGYAIDFGNEKNISYKRHHHVSFDNSLVYRDPTGQKFIHFDHLYFSQQDGPSRLLTANVDFSKNPARLAKNMKKAEKEAKEDEEIRAKEGINRVVASTFNIPQIESKTIARMNDMLKTMDFYDSVESLFKDWSNTTMIECRINEAMLFNFVGNKFSSYQRLRLNCTWFVKNNFGEKLDSFTTEALSGEIIMGKISLVYDAVAENFVQLIQDQKFIAHTKNTSSKEEKPEPIVFADSLAFLSKTEQVPLACVTVKTSSGHGSGFAISNDGYIITNFHVIAGDNFNSFAAVQVTDNQGVNYYAKVVRVSRTSDLALLKIEKNFDFCFDVRNPKPTKPLEKVYSYGTPITTELAGSVSVGVVSGDKIQGSNSLVQLNMSVSPGNSGGPVFNDQCELIGVIVSRLTSAELNEYSFAVPVKDIGVLLGY